MPKRQTLLPLLLLTLLFACQPRPVDIQTEPTPAAPLTISADSIRLEGDTGPFRVEKSVEQLAEGLQLITFTFTADRPATLSPVSIRFDFPSVDINGYWNPAISFDRVSYYRSAFSAKATSNAPVLSFYNNGLQNRLTLALSDALNRADFSSYLREEDVRFYPVIRLFREPLPATAIYRITLRIDTRPVTYYRALDDVAYWWATLPGYKPMHVPDDAKRPVYSTWYSYHQKVDTRSIVDECRMAASLGCTSVIVDDGWQTTDSNRGYAYTGDWQPVRMPDMKAFVDSVHALGMKVLLWYSLPFIGEKAANFAEFKGKYLAHWASQGTWVLDPRYPEVREFIAGTYEQALRNWNLDGFKLDFIGRFVPNEQTVLTADNGRDYASVYEAVDVLMTEISNRLTRINPEILIEFRQPYIGPLMRKYGNMFRGVDAPNNAVANRIETVNLRLLSQNTAVHSDMFIWRPEEPVEKAALQILNILYSVPQLSVKLAEIPADHLEMIRFWFGFWNDYRDALVNGEFIPSDPLANYPVLTGRNGRTQVTTLYQDVVAEAESFDTLFLVNAKASPAVALKLKKPFRGKLTVRDCRGNIVHQGTAKLQTGISTLTIPPSGLASLSY